MAAARSATTIARIIADRRERCHADHMIRHESGVIRRQRCR
jgi:hypothetical protein